MRVYISILFACLLASSCAHLKLQPVMELEGEPIAEGISPAEFQEIAMTASINRGWVFRRAGDNRLIGTLRVRSHEAVVEIRHSATAYTIRYRDSENLGYTGSEIHRNYNRWILNLNADIRREMAAESAGALREDDRFGDDGRTL